MDTSRFFGGITSLARAIDPSYASNRLAVTAAGVFTLAGTVLTLVVTDTTFLAAVTAGLAYGVGAFLAWAIGRELDPDRPVAARYAIAAYAVIAVTGRPELLAVAALMVALRVITRSTGKGPTAVDLAALVVLAGLAGRSSAGFIAGAVLAAALWIDTRLTDPDAPIEHSPVAETPQHTAAGLAFGAAFAVTLVSGAFLSGWRGPTALEAVVVLVAAAAMTRMRVGRLTSTADLTRLPLDPVRVRRGQQIAGVAFIVGVLWTGFEAVAALGPLLAAITGAGIVGWRRPPE